MQGLRRWPIDAPADDSVVAAPADCAIDVIHGESTDTTPIPVKTVTTNVKTLLGGSGSGSGLAERFVGTADHSGGTAVSCVLPPDTYHRHHAPVTGCVVEARDGIAGIHYAA